jgi:hypothetical protein
MAFKISCGFITLLCFDNYIFVAYDICIYQISERILRPLLGRRGSSKKIVTTIGQTQSKRVFRTPWQVKVK